MKKILAFIPLICASLEATDYTFVDLNSPYHFVSEVGLSQPCRPWHVEADWSHVGKAKVTTSGKAKNSRFETTAGFASIYYSQYLNAEHALAWQLGYAYMRFDWPKNPRFSQKDFHYGLFSLAWISNGIEDWRWVIMGGLTANLQTKFGRSAVGYGLVWGRYVYLLEMGIHVGFFGYYGAKNGYLLPILGLDWLISEKWKFNAVLPLDLSLDYHFNPNWFAELSYTTFGGPYRFPYRFKGGVGRYKNGIFEFYSTGVDLSLNYTYKTIFMGRIAGGYNFGGWALIKDAHDHHAKYYKYNGAPYIAADLDITF